MEKYKFVLGLYTNVKIIVFVLKIGNIDVCSFRLLFSFDSVLNKLCQFQGLIPCPKL